jgi:hypothetical protein
MARTHRSRRIERHEDLAAKLSAARAANHRQILKLRAATDQRIHRLARLIRTPEAMDELERLVDVLLDLWDEVAAQAQAQEAAHEYIKELRSRD